MNIAYLITTYNRKENTLNCLKELYALDYPEGINFEIYLTDDFSTDGTFEAISSLYPQVHLSKSSGNLYWNRGMLNSWRKAIERTKYDAYVWVNDDNHLYKNAFIELYNCASEMDFQAVVCGCFCDPHTKEFTYGGKDKQGIPIYPNKSIQKIYLMNGNFVLVPSFVVDKIGLLDSRFIHIKGDYDYGLMALENNISVVSTTQYVGESKKNPISFSRGRILGQNVVKRFYSLFNSPFVDNPFINYYFNRKHHLGIFLSGCYFMKTLLITILPDFLYLKIRGK